MGDESSKCSTPMNRSSDTAGEHGEGGWLSGKRKGSHPLARDLVFNFALL